MALGVGLLLRRQLGVAQQRGHAENAVHRRADLVAHGGQEARLGAVGRLRLLARLASARPRSRAASVMSRPRHCTSGTAASAAGHGVLLPLEPARPGASSRSPARSAAGAARAPGASGADHVAGEHARARTPGPARRRRSQPEHPAERLVDEGQPALGVAAQDDVGLVVEQIAVARLVLADLPLDVLELLEAALEALADAAGSARTRPRDRDGAQPADGAGRSRRGASHGLLHCSEPGAQTAGQALAVEPRLTHARLSSTPVAGSQPRRH